MTQRFYRTWFILVVIAVIGCNSAKTIQESRRGAVSGTVTVNGKPLTTGTVLLESADHSVATVCPIGPDGSFTGKTLEGSDLPIGEYRIAISVQKIGETDERLLSADAEPKMPTASVPKRYRQLGTSGLTLQVAEGTNTPVQLELASE